MMRAARTRRPARGGRQAGADPDRHGGRPRPQPGRAHDHRVGALAARRDQPVGVAGEGGMVAPCLVDAGSWVRQGQVLATIDRSVQAQEAAQLAAQVQVARADAALAQNEYERSQSLVGAASSAKADLDRKKAARDAAFARVRVAEAKLARPAPRSAGSTSARRPAA
jgi:multidrug efflux pump subunit AcrA (membrane-fusion protein)